MHLLSALKQAAPPPRDPVTPNPMTPEMQRLLEQLKDIHEPAQIGWWPLAPGWWILAGVIIILLFAASWLLLRAHKKRLRNRYRAEGVRLLNALDLDAPRVVEEINILLKRVAVVTFGRDTCAPLTGQRWIQFLESTVEAPMPDAARRALLENLYSASHGTEADLRALREFAVSWTRKHQCAQAAAIPSIPAPQTPTEKTEAEHV
ncbi:DUF4381 domain-containing protein [uncultured Microbulbifer sp.]|uniref:DUF4381 domain-containing protein n=1 Tax=uncultured Microbulbifer sp. TaxID=348147 RepID=UPI00261B1488|nr:DUF4381 domain-containing protein [uncultured Microbulbifer sp.]